MPLRNPLREFLLTGDQTYNLAYFITERQDHNRTDISSVAA